MDKEYIGIKRDLQESFKNYINSKGCDKTFIVNGFINRQINLIFAIENLLKEKNKLGAESLLRSLYEYLILFTYLNTSEKGDNILNLIINNTEIYKAMNNMKVSYSDMDIHFREGYLKDKNKFKNVYSYGCHYVHFSHISFFENAKLLKNGDIKLNIGKQLALDEDLNIINDLMLGIGRQSELLIYHIIEKNKYL